MHTIITMYRHRWLLALVLIVVIAALLLPQTALAAEASPGPIVKLLYTVVISVFGGLMGIGGAILNFAINHFVIGFGLMFSSPGVGAVVDATWSTIRDLFNLTFIFGLVYIGFKMILGTDDSSSKRWIASLVLAAILVNFSLFISKFIVDISNIFAVEILNLDRADGGGPVFRNDPNPITIGGISFTGVLVSDSMTDALNVTTVVSSAGDAEKLALREGAGYMYVIGIFFVLVIAAYVFFSAGILLIVRGAVLLILIIVSPLLFLGWVIPAFKSFSDRLWKRLLSAAFLAPIYILLLYLSLSIANGFSGSSNFKGALTAPSGEAIAEATAGTFGAFAVICTFLLISLMAAKKISEDGANTALKTSQKIAGAATAGLAARGGRKLIGGMGNRVAENEKVQRMARRGGLVGLTGRAIADTGHKARTSSFDMRNVGGLGEKSGLGKGKTGGYAADQKEKEKKEKERAERYSTREDNQFYEDVNDRTAQAKRDYDAIIDNLDQVMADLANETDPARRAGHLRDALRLNRNKKHMEDGVEFNAATGEATLDADGKPVKDRTLDDFNYIRKNNKALRQNSYAANLERRGQDFGFISALMTDQQTNTKASNAIRQEMSKNSDQRLIDAVRNQNNN